MGNTRDAIDRFVDLLGKDVTILSEPGPPYHFHITSIRATADNDKLILEVVTHHRTDMEKERAAAWKKMWDEESVTVTKEYSVERYVSKETMERFREIYG